MSETEGIAPVPSASANEAVSPHSRPRDRRAGILLHPTSLPGSFGIGDVGPAAVAFLHWAAQAGQRLWQVLPLGPTGFGNSPYGALSSFAGNPLLISPEELRDAGLVEEGDLATLSAASSHRADFVHTPAAKEALLRRAHGALMERGSSALRSEFEEFLSAESSWLDDWSLFAALKQHHQGREWLRWDRELALREEAALASAQGLLAEEISFQGFVQFQFFAQWRRVRDVARALGIEIVGDLPIYTALDSADVWANRDLFELDSAGYPLAVSGVPPDAFSEDGQLWGTPLYAWERHVQSDFRWWKDRVAANLRLCDRLRLDHFRGFAAYWRVPGGARTAKEGCWVPGPGMSLFSALAQELGSVPLWAEDLGVITPDVEALLAEAGFPGMKVLQFAFAEPNSEHLLHHHRQNSTVYTGTHDNDTSRGWFAKAGAEERRRVLDYLGLESGYRIERALIRTAYVSPADSAIVPMQDILGLGGDARMNTPGLAAGNWSWRLREDDVKEGIGARLLRLAEISDRIAATSTEGDSA